uniref:Uncharacterized protein n=1 Tax=Lepeophtheirus salmonis TaxID=72036 RepID=A0A0K2SWM6_LEPSM
MMLVLVASNRKPMNPVWFPLGYRLKADEYVIIQYTEVLPWIPSIVGNYPWVLQQDGTVDHTANKTQKWL